MPFPITATAQALDLAQALRLSPEGKKRLSRCEKMWSYRTYQGGDSATKIDWRQSARTQEPVVRSHEGLSARTVYLYATCGDEILRGKLYVLLLALADLLAGKERPIGWLSPERARITQTQSLLPSLITEGFDATPEKSLFPTLPLTRSLLVIAGDLSQQTEAQIMRLTTYAEQGTKGVYLDLATDGDATKTFMPEGWLILPFNKEADEESLLVELLDAAITLSR